MKRFLAMVLLLTLLSASALGERFAPENMAQARRQAMDLLQTCAFTGGSGDEEREIIIRWVEPIRVCAAGMPNSKDLKQLDDFLLQLNYRVPEMPMITRVETPEEANLVIHYCKLSEMTELVPGYEEGNWGMVTYSYHSNGQVFSAVIGLARDKTSQTARNHLMREELTGALGLTGHHDAFSDSILYRPWTTVQHLSEVDWMMLNMLYSPHVFPGWTWTQVQQALLTHYKP